MDPGYLSLATLHIVLRPGLSLNLKFVDLAMLVGQLASETCLSCLHHPMLELQESIIMSIFTWMLGIQTQVHAHTSSFLTIEPPL